jgi:hypothetical protein
VAKKRLEEKKREFFARKVKWSCLLANSLKNKKDCSIGYSPAFSLLVKFRQNVKLQIQNSKVKRFWRFSITRS